MDENARLWVEWALAIRSRPADDPIVVLLIAFPLWALALATVALHKALGGR
jgi:hypothetical protein